MSFIGNDIVSLTDVNNRLSFQNDRYLQKSFVHREFDEIKKFGKEWPFLLWSCKESAYKARVKQGHRKPFCPINFQVYHSPVCPKGTGNYTALSGQVENEGHILTTKSWVCNDYIHTICSTEGFDALNLIYGVRKTGNIPRNRQSAGVRKFITGELALKLNVDVRNIKIKKNSETEIPFALISTNGSEINLTLSHDGEFIAYACIIPLYAKGVEKKITK